MGMSKLGDRRKFLTQVEQDFTPEGTSRMLSTSRLPNLPVHKLPSNPSGSSLRNTGDLRVSTHLQPSTSNADNSGAPFITSPSRKVLKPAASRDIFATPDGKRILSPNNARKSRAVSMDVNNSPIYSKTSGTSGAAGAQKMCCMCESEVAILACNQCEEEFCQECDTEMHSVTGFKSHLRTKMSQEDSSSNRLHQNVGMVRVLALRAAEDTNRQILKALGADNLDENTSTFISNASINNADMELDDFDISNVSLTVTPAKPITTISNHTNPDETSTLSNTSSSTGIFTITPSLSPFASQTTNDLAAGIASSSGNKSLVYVPPLSFNGLDPKLQILPEDEKVHIDTIHKLATPPRLSVNPDCAHTTPRSITPRPSRYLVSPNLSSPGMQSMRAKGKNRGNNMLVSPMNKRTSGVFASPRVNPMLLSPNHLSSPMHGSNNGGSHYNFASPSLSARTSGTGLLNVPHHRDITMTKEAQTIITKVKTDVVTAVSEANMAGLQVAAAKAKHEQEKEELDNAESEYERKKAIATVAARKANDSEEDKKLAKQAEEDARRALEKLEKERQEALLAEQDEKRALKRAEAAFAKQLQAKTLANQVVQMEHMVSKPTRQITGDEAIVRIQAWSWENGYKRGKDENSQPLVCIEIPYSEFLYYKKSEDEQEVKEGNANNHFAHHPPPNSNSEQSMLSLPSIHKSTATPRNSARGKGVSPKNNAAVASKQLSETEVAFMNVQKYLNYRLYTSLQKAKSQSASIQGLTNVHSPSLDVTHAKVGKVTNPSTLTVLHVQVPESDRIEDVLRDTPISSVSSDFALPALKKLPTTRGMKPTNTSMTDASTGGSANPEVVTPNVLCKDLCWTQPLLGVQLSTFTDIANYMPSITQQLHHIRNRYEVYGGADLFDSFDRHPGCAGTPLCYPYRYDILECVEKYQQSASQYTIPNIRHQEQEAILQRWKTERKLVIPVDIILTPVSTTSASGTSTSANLTLLSTVSSNMSSGMYKFLWNDHSTREEVQRVLRECKHCKRYFSTDVNHGSGCRKHISKVQDILLPIRKKVETAKTSTVSGIIPSSPSNAVVSSISTLLSKQEYVIHPCCGHPPVELSKLPPLTTQMYDDEDDYVDEYMYNNKRNMYSGGSGGSATTSPSNLKKRRPCELNGGLMNDEEYEVISDDDEPLDIDVELAMIDDDSDDDIVGYSTAPDAKRKKWSELYPNEPVFGCVPSRHDGPITVPLRLRALTAREMRLRREEEKRQSRLVTLGDQSNDQIHTLEKKLEELTRDIHTWSTFPFKNLTSVQICAYDGDVHGRIDKTTNLRREPCFTFTYVFSKELHPDKLRLEWSKKVIDVFNSQYTKYNTQKSRKTGDLTLHCPYTNIQITDIPSLQVLPIISDKYVDIVFYGKSNKPKYTTYVVPQETDMLGHKYTVLRGYKDAQLVNGLTGEQAQECKHWSVTDKSSVVRCCRICGELFQTSTHNYTKYLSSGVITQEQHDNYLHNGCSKYNLTHPSTSSIFLPYTTDLIWAYKIRELRNVITKTEAEYHKKKKLQELAKSLVKAYDEYAQNSLTQAESDSEDDDDDDDVNGTYDGDTWIDVTEPVYNDLTDTEIDIYASKLSNIYSARLTCCTYLLYQYLVEQNSSKYNMLRNNIDVNDRILNSNMLLRGWRLLSLIDMPQTPKQAAELGLLMKERDRSNVLILRIFDDRKEGRKRGAGDTPLFTVTIRVTGRMDIDLVKYNIYETWKSLYPNDTHMRNVDFRHDILLRHPISGQQFIAVNGVELHEKELILTQLNVPYARTYTHIHTDLDDEDIDDDINVIIPSAISTCNIQGVKHEIKEEYCDYIHSKMAWKFTPMYDLYGPGVCLTDWSDIKGRVDVILYINNHPSFTPAAPPAFLYNMVTPQYKYYNNTGLNNTTVPFKTPNIPPTTTDIRTLFQNQVSGYLTFNSNLVPPNNIRTITTASTILPNLSRRRSVVHNTPVVPNVSHIYPLEMLYVSRCCAVCDDIFCLAMYSSSAEDTSTTMCQYHPQEGIKQKNGYYEFPCCKQVSKTCVPLRGGFVAPNMNNNVKQAYRGEYPCKSVPHTGHIMYPVRYFTPPKIL